MDYQMTTRAPSQTLPNRSVLDTARTFFEAGELLYEQKPGKGFYLPASNLLCHAIELYMKSLANPPQWKLAGGDVFMEITERSKESHKLVGMLDDMESYFREDLLKKRASLRCDLAQLEGLFQASRYPFEVANIKQVTNGSDRIAFSVAKFLACEVRDLPTFALPTDKKKQ